MARIRRPWDPPPAPKPKANKNRNRNRNNNNKNKNKNKNQNQAANDTGGVSDATTPGTTTAFAIQDPAAWLRSNMAAAGFSHVNAATDYGRFLNDAVVSPFVAGWQEWQASRPAAHDQDFWDYTRGTNMGLPEAITGGPPGDADDPAQDILPFNAFVRQETGKGRKDLNKGRRQRLRNRYNDYVAGQEQNANTNPLPTPESLPLASWQQFNNAIQNQIDKYSLQQQGRYDAGKQPGSIRTNLFA